MAKKGKLSRRSFLTRVAGGIAATGVVAAGAGAAVMRGRSDADPVDPAGNGRTGITDNDSGGGADQAGRGTGYTGYTDADSGSCADQGGHGRGNTGFTDSDQGACGDPGGRGRG